MTARILIAVLALAGPGIVPGGEPPGRVELTVPLVTQDTETARRMCGPACIEMVFRFWKIEQEGQHAIVRDILKSFPETKRYRESGILEGGEPDLEIYPGTGTITMREYLRRFGEVENLKVKEILKREQHLRDRDEMFARLKSHLAAGRPVIVHQYTSAKSRTGHYRVVTGYEENPGVVFLNDPRPKNGGRIEQTFARFLDLWNVDEPWLHYNALAFVPAGQG